MKYINLIITYGLLSITCLSHAVLVKMPNADELNDRFNQAELTDFAKATKIVARLADKEFQTEGIVTKITLASMDYVLDVMKNYSPKNAAAILDHFHMRENMIYPILLQGNPEAFKELEEAGLYNPTNVPTINKK